MIFDNDGVLVDSEVLANTVLVDLLAEAGYHINFDGAVEQFLGGSLQRVRDVVEPVLGRPLPADFEDRYHQELFAKFRSELKPVPGVIDALEAITAPVCVASSGTPARIQLALQVTGLAERFDNRIFSATDVAHGKPAPDLFLLAAERLGACPARCAVVEDSPLGVQAAKAAGMTAFGYSAFTPASRLAEADVCLDDMAALPGLLRSVSRPTG